ncbi:MAG: rod shape-determining protein [Epulopiscium sp. Nuni2H_MBin003]|nr:MAG: rod shape-determining protein [Epulopiscium sp. Nuni2H_MBin003]
MFFKGSGIGIDLGTTSVLVYNDKKGIVLQEPSVVAMNEFTGSVLAIGEEAHKMRGKAPRNIKIIRPLRQGVISDYDVTEIMLKHFIKKAIGKRLIKPRIAVCVPSGITEIEKRAVENATRQSGARRVKIITEPLAAAIGAQLDVRQPYGNMVVDIGGGTSDIAVISLSGEVINSSLRIAGDNFDDAIIVYIRKTYNLAIGEVTAENIKIEIGGALDRNQPTTMEIKGVNIVDGLPKRIEITSTEITQSISEIVDSIIQTIYNVLELTPPELIADILEKGMILTGGGSLLYGLDKLIYERLGIAANIATEPVKCVAIGTGLFAMHAFDKEPKIKKGKI